jgi:CRP-like cAMP-binding protein
MSGVHQPTNTLVQRLNMLADLPSEVDQALENVIAQVRTYAANQDIVSQGDQPTHCAVILDGWISRNKVLKEGKRQITALHFAGVTPDLQSLFTPALDHNISTLTEASVGFIPHAHLRELMERFPVLAQIFWRETLVDAAIAREWEVNLAARSSVKRIAHIFCEVATRLEWFGKATREGATMSFQWPLTQIQLSEATGLSVVHTNRSLMQLRATKLMDITQQRVTIFDVQKLEALAGFNPDYLAAEEPRKGSRQN